MTSETPDTPSTDPDDCPQCGEQRDAPWADCAACGFIQPSPCGDLSGRCLYRGEHDGPHKVAVRETPDTPSTEARKVPYRQVAVSVVENTGYRSDTPSTEAHRPADCPCWRYWRSDGTCVECGRAVRQEAAATSGLREAGRIAAEYVEAMDAEWQEVKDPHESDEHLDPSWVAFRDSIRAALEGATERPLDGACSDPACAYREEVRLGRLVPVEVVRATERRATETLSAIVVAVGGEVRVPDRVVVAGSCLRVESDPVAHETVYRASPTTTEDGS
jgi:hypothetical protein